MGGRANRIRTKIENRGKAALIHIQNALTKVGQETPLRNLKDIDVDKIAERCTNLVKRVLNEFPQGYRKLDHGEVATQTHDASKRQSSAKRMKFTQNENWENEAMEIRNCIASQISLMHLRQELQKSENYHMLNQLKLLQQQINTAYMKSRVRGRKLPRSSVMTTTQSKTCHQDLSLTGKGRKTNDTVITNAGVEKNDAACPNSTTHDDENAKNRLNLQQSNSAQTSFKQRADDDDSTMDCSSAKTKGFKSLDFDDFNINNDIFSYACMDGNDSGDKGTTTQTTQNQNNGHSSNSNHAAGHGHGNTPSSVSGSGANQGNDGNGEDPRKPSKNERIGGCSSDVSEARRKDRSPNNNNQPEADQNSSTDDKDGRHGDLENTTAQQDPARVPEEIHDEHEPRCHSPEWSPASAHTSRAGPTTPALPRSDNDMPQHGAAGFPTTKQLIPQAPQYARQLSTSPVPNSPPSSLTSCEDDVPEEHLNLNGNPKEALLNDNQLEEVPVHSLINAKESLHPHPDQDHLHSGLLPGRRNDSTDIFRDTDRANDPRSEHPVFPQHPPITRAEDNRQIPPPPPDPVSSEGPARSALDRLLTYLDRSAQDDRNRGRCVVDQGYNRKGQALQADGRADLVQRHDNSFSQEPIPREVNLRPNQPIRASIEERRIDRTFRDPPGGSGRRNWFCHSCSSAHMISGVPDHACDDCGRFFCLEHWERHECVWNWFLDDVDEAQAVPEDGGNVQEVEDVELVYNDEEENDERDDDNGQSDDCSQRRSFSG